MKSSKKEIEQLRAAITLSRIPGVGAKKFKELVLKYGTPAQALIATPRQLPLFIDSDEHNPSVNLEKRKEVTHLPSSIGFSYFGASNYPLLLSQTPEPPPYIFYKGALWPIPQPSVAIVGARQCTDQGRAFARTLAQQLATLGVTIMSGGAQGIDTAAHSGALEGNGSTVLVTASGIERIYPPENKALFHRIEKSGCILSELFPLTPPRRDSFISRNRIIVGLSNVVVIVEGKPRSGTFSSIGHAKKLGRKIFVWLKSPHKVYRNFAQQLVGQGAEALLNPVPDQIIKHMKSFSQNFNIL